jgi:PAS domain S-box-containing protein
MLEPLITRIREGVLQFDANGRCVAANNRACALLGLEKAQVIAKRARDLLQLEGGRDLEALAPGEHTAATTPREGGLRAHLTVQLDRFDGGTLVFLQPGAEVTLAESVQRAGLGILDRAPVTLWALDREGHIVLSEGGGIPALEQSRTSPRDRVLGMKLVDVTEDPRIPENHARALRGESFSSLVSFRSRVLDAWYGPLKDDEGRVLGTVGIGMDVTEAQRIADELRKSEAMNRRLIDAVRGGILLVSPEGEVLRANLEAQRILGLSYLEIEKRFVADFDTEVLREDGSPCPVEEYPVSRCLRTQQPQEGEVIGVRRRDGSFAWAIYSATPISDPGTGTFIGVVVSFIDITDRKRATEERHSLEQQLHQSQKLEAIGRLAGGVAHDFNNLLTAILGHTHLLRAGAVAGSDIDQTLSTIELAAERAADLTRRLLGFARKGKFQAIPVDLGTAIDEVIELLGHTIPKNIRITRAIPADQAKVLGDPVQIQQVLLNLAINACDAMPSGGKLEFSIAPITLGAGDPRMEQRGARAGAFLKVSVKDDGTGIADDVRGHIFEPFFTTKPPGKGTGMGLAMVYGIVRNHGGWIDVETELGAGTTFHIHLPVVDRAEKEDAGAMRTTPPRKRARILVIDDEELIRRTAEAILRSLGHEVVTVPDGLSAVEVYPSGAPFDLVIVDLMMPRLDGRECFTALRRLDPGVRAILSSGYGLDGMAQQILDEGMIGFVQKPYRRAELAEAVERALS